MYEPCDHSTVCLYFSRDALVYLTPGKRPTRPNGKTCLLIDFVSPKAVARQTQVRFQNFSSSLTPLGWEIKDPENEVYANQGELIK